MRVVQRRLKQTEVLIWLTIVGILLGSASVVATDWLTQRSDAAANAASASLARSRMRVDSDSMPQVEPYVPPTTRPSTTTTAVKPTTAKPATTTPPTTKVPAKVATTTPPTAKPTTTAPPETRPTTTAPPETKPTTTLPPETRPTTTLPPETRPTTTLPPETRPTTTLPPETKPTTTQPPETLPPETRPPQAEIVGFVLIDAKADVDLMWLYDGAVLSLDEISNKLSVRAEVTQDVGSVVWYINGKKVKIENDNPYALAGNNGDDYGVVKFEPGKYTFTAQMFSERKGKGDAGHAVSMTVTFTEDDDDDEDDD